MQAADLARAGWRRVIFAADVEANGDVCPGCGGDYGECPCPGPTMDEMVYTQDADGQWWARHSYPVPPRHRRGDPG